MLKYINIYKVVYKENIISHSTLHQLDNDVEKYKLYFCHTASQKYKFSNYYRPKCKS